MDGIEGAMASFEDQLAELEKVVDRLERGDLTLEENVSLFERGVVLSNACKTQLSSAESRIQVLLQPEQSGIRTENLAVGGGEEENDGEGFGDDEIDRDDGKR
jgi:exodeoxyribonuclease VII small subunit